MFWMMGIGTRRSSFGHGCGSVSVKPAVGSPSPQNVLPQAGMTGQEIPARREILARPLGSALVPSRSATIISTALDKVRHLTDEETITRMEHALTTTAVETDPDFVTTMTKRWIDSIDQNGPEPSEELLRQHQGAFLRKRRRYGLHHIEIFATDEQYETLTTVMNTATNPRLTTGRRVRRQR